MKERRTFASVIAIVTGLAVAGCADWSYSPAPRGTPSSAATNLSAAQDGIAKNPRGFLDYLGNEYTAYAGTLSQQGSLVNADYFARKALGAEHGFLVEPEQNAAWGIPLEQPLGFRTQLAQARTRLMTALNGGARERAPAVAARAQARYDCWVADMERDWQSGQNGQCRREFLAAMDELESKPAAVAPANVVDIYFDFNKATLTLEARQIIQQLAAQLKTNGASTITIVGKTDLTGSTGYNLALSKRRAETVQAELVKAGVAAGRMKVQWTGDGEPPVKTGHGVREPRNRVVEIMVR
jgi:OmpA-OmpF porin, OOP family